MSQITVTVPATTANLGPGFDCLGLAVSLYNTVTLRPAAADAPPLTIHLSGEGAAQLPRDERNLCWQAAQRLFAAANQWPTTNLIMHQENQIPVGSGLGSSAAAVVAGLVAANQLVQANFSPAQLLQLATEFEGHPDNVAPALLGGLVLVQQEGDTIQWQSLPVAAWQLLVVLPTFDLPTAQARAALPQTVSLADAIFNLGRFGFLLSALQTGDEAQLAQAMQDRLHQPYRMPLVPGLVAAVAAAKEMGAAATALSGAGPSLIAFMPAHAPPTMRQKIAQHAQHAFHQAGLTSRVWHLTPDTQGTRWS